MSDSAVFFKPWVTDFADDDLQILQVSYLDGGLEATRRLDDGRYARSSIKGDGRSDFSLTIKVFSYTKSRIFQISFEYVSAYRVLDEHGLCDLWSLERPNRSTFKVGGHGWTQESPISFSTAGEESWMVATDWDCVEIISSADPIIRDLGLIESEIVDELPDAKSDDQLLAGVLAGAIMTKRLH